MKKLIALAAILFAFSENTFAELKQHQKDTGPPVSGFRVVSNSIYGLVLESERITPKTQNTPPFKQIEVNQLLHPSLYVFCYHVEGTASLLPSDFIVVYYTDKGYIKKATEFSTVKEGIPLVSIIIQSKTSKSTPIRKR